MDPRPAFSDDYYRMTGRRLSADSLPRRAAQLFSSHALRFLFFWRKVQRGEDPLGIFRLLKKGLFRRTGLDLNSMSVGKGLYLGHPYNISVCSSAVIGDNCNLNKGARIGTDCSGAAPVIGDRVWIGANAVITGGIRIGSNVLIAPNAYVDADVPSDSIVIGNPAQILTGRPDATAGYINRTV